MDTEMDSIRNWWARFHAASTLNDLQRFVHDAGVATISESRSSTVFQLDQVASLAVEQWLKKAIDEKSEVMQCLQILEECLDAKIGTRTNAKNHRSHEFAKEIRKWLENLDVETRTVVRRTIYGRLSSELENGSLEQACALISSLGYADQGVILALLDRFDPSSASSIDVVNALLDVGIKRLPQSSFAEYIRQRVDAVPTGGIAGLEYTIQEVADKAVLPILCKVVTEELTKAHDESLDFSRNVGLLASLAKHHPDDLALQEVAWSPFAEALRSVSPRLVTTLAFRGDIVPRFNSTTVCSQFLRAVAFEFAAGRISEHGRTISYYRALKAIRPNCVMSQFELGQEVRAMLQNDASACVIGDGFGIREIRKSALELACCHCAAESIAWLPEIAKSAAGNPVLLADLFEKCATLGLSQMPQEALELARQDQVVGQITKGHDVWAHLSAIRLLAASPSRLSFDTLLDCQYRFENGEGMLDVMLGLGNAALWHARNGDESASRRLLAKVTDTHASQWERSTALGALWMLANYHPLAESYFDQLIEVWNDPAWNDLMRSRLLAMLSEFLESRGGEVRPLLIGACEAKDGERQRMTALTVLARKGSESDLREVVVRELQTSLAEETRPEYLASAASVVGIVFSRFPEHTKGMLRQFLDVSLTNESRDSKGWAGVRWISAGGMLWEFLREVKTFASQTHIATLGPAAVAACAAQQSASAANADVLRLVAEMFPDSFTIWRWETEWVNWIPEAKVGMSEALGGYVKQGADLLDRVAALLEVLIQDAAFEVRRSAWRSFSRIVPTKAEELAKRWGTDGSVPLRRLASEAIAWLSSPQAASDLLDVLCGDSEPPIRESAERSKEERRKRSWAKLYLDNLEGRLFDSESSAIEHRIANAIVHLGDDETIAAIKVWSSNVNVPPFRRALLSRIGKSMAENWKSAAAKWPEPWLPVTATIEYVHASICVPGEEGMLNCPVALTHSKPSSPGTRIEWEATIHPADDSLHSLSWFAKEVEMRIEGRQPAMMLVVSVLGAGQVRACGLGEYPQMVVSHQ